MTSADGAIVGTLVIDRAPDAVAGARRWVVRQIAAMTGRPLKEDAVDDLVLCASEVINNAVRHSGHGGVGGPISITMLDRHRAIRLEVRDGGNDAGRRPARARVGTGATSGRGLGIVEILATAWGNDVDDAGRTTVWFEIAY
ncbi:ATP-binding protein [Actinomadura viridis]|uniref:ATP-binding protein n=1 Tax=Actinomadura viridis TaxID=58110 RepID=UPI00368615A0